VNEGAMAHWGLLGQKRKVIILASLTVYSPPSSADDKNEWSYTSSPLLLHGMLRHFTIYLFLTADTNIRRKILFHVFNYTSVI
jgi:hypothetical protein